MVAKKSLLMYKKMEKLVAHLLYMNRLCFRCFHPKVEMQEMVTQIDLVVYSARWSRIHF